MSAKDSTPDIFAITDLATRQAHKTAWDAINAARADHRGLSETVTGVQSTLSDLSANVSAIGGLGPAVAALTQGVNQATDHPFLRLTNSAATTAIPNATNTSLTWDTERASSSGFHSPTVDSDKVFVGNKPGIWLSVFMSFWAANAAGLRASEIVTSSGVVLASLVDTATAYLGAANGQIATAGILTLGAQDPDGANYVIANVFQNSGAPLNIVGSIGSGGFTYKTTWTFYYLGPLPVNQ